IEAYDVKMAMLVALIFPLVILIFTALSSINGFGTSAISNPGPHGFSQMLYAFVSGAGNNGSAFGGLSANTLWYNTTMGFDMLIGRFLMMIPMPAIASIGIIIRNRPINMSNPMVVLYQSVLALSPPNAEPLLPAPETNAYNIWLNPCGPGLEIADVPKPLIDEIAVNIKITSGKTSATSMAIFTS